MEDVAPIDLNAVTTARAELAAVGSATRRNAVLIALGYLDAAATGSPQRIMEARLGLWLLVRSTRATRRRLRDVLAAYNAVQAGRRRWTVPVSDRAAIARVFGPRSPDRRLLKGVAGLRGAPKTRAAPPG